MARPLRLEFPGALYHVTARGNARQEIYRDDVDRQRFLDMLGREIGQQGWLCYAYCLMSNHYHLLLETPEANLSNGMRRLNGAYGQMFNRRHDQVGHLFQGRYGSIVVDKDSYLLELCRYVVLNPVRAGVVKHPRQWRWSSYRATVGLSPSPHWLDSEWVLEQFGQSENKAPIAYSRFVAEGHGAPSPWHRLRDQVWLGNDQFLARMQDRVLGSNRPGIPLAQTRPARPDKQAILDAVSAAYKVAPTAVTDRVHLPAYRAAAFLLRRAANLPLRETADTFSVSPSRISRIQNEIETGLQDPCLKQLLSDFGVQ